jgi:hypothetical protein
MGLSIWDSAIAMEDPANPSPGSEGARRSVLSSQFPYLRLGVIAAAVVIAALFSVLGRPNSEKVERPKGVAIVTSPTITPPSSASPQKPAALKANPPETLLQEMRVPTIATKDVSIQLDPRKLMNLMNTGVTKYTSEPDEANKASGARLIQIAALAGYETARNLIVTNYPRAASIRTAVPASDVILYAVDLLMRQADAGTQFAALANYFSARGDAPRFAKIVVDVARDSAPVRDPEKFDRLFKSLSPVPGVCSSLKRVILKDPAIDENECSETLRASFFGYVKQNAPTGLERDARVRGVELLRKTDGEP